jgi:hypothetical protein
MRFDALRNHLAPALFLGILLGMPLSSTACGRTACFSWSKGEGACPAQKDALTFFSDPRCPGNVVSVDSEATVEFEGRLCCYEVTQNDVHFDQGEANLCDPGASSGAGAQGAGGFSSGSSGVTTSVASSGTTGAGGNAGCIHCAEAFGSSIPPDGVLCPGSKELLFVLSDCVCNGACIGPCADTLCTGFSPSEGCGTCMQDPEGGCGNELQECANDL